MYLTILFLPLFSSIVTGFLGRKLGAKGSQLTSCLSILITTLLVIIVFFEVAFNNIIINIKLFK
jgi:NADH:ubiquinone oxidoreductase subunit 5 (subunit L)/multisubunit Na+/H+ antiporter MnhA subunit